jgi:acetolactate decarboxylase
VQRETKNGTLDGEMVVIDGHFFQVCGDGSVREAKDDVLSPFAVIIHFKPDAASALQSCVELKNLLSEFDKLRKNGQLFLCFAC